MTTTAAKRLDVVERFVSAAKAEIRHGGARAFYGLSTDRIQMPDRDHRLGNLEVPVAPAQCDRRISVFRMRSEMNAFDQDMMALIKGQPDANSGWTRLKVECVEALSGTLTLKSLGAKSCKGEALVAIHTNGAGEVPMSSNVAQAGRGSAM